MKVIEFVKKRGKSVYIAKMYITDHDIEMIEDLATCYCNKGANKHTNPILIDLKKRYNKWLLETFKELQRFWKKYD